MKISYLFSSVYGRARGGGRSAYCGAGGGARRRHRVYLACHVVDFPRNESKVLADPGMVLEKEFSPFKITALATIICDSVRYVSCRAN